MSWNIYGRNVYDNYDWSNFEEIPAKHQYRAAVAVLENTKVPEVYRTLCLSNRGLFDRVMRNFRVVQHLIEISARFYADYTVWGLFEKVPQELLKRIVLEWSQIIDDGTLHHQLFELCGGKSSTNNRYRKPEDHDDYIHLAIENPQKYLDIGATHGYTIFSEPDHHQLIVEAISRYAVQDPDAVECSMPQDTDLKFEVARQIIHTKDCHHEQVLQHVC